jgi:small-conductance mechanosensitive channel
MEGAFTGEDAMPRLSRPLARTSLFLLLWISLVAVFLLLDRSLPDVAVLPSGLTGFQLSAVLAGALGFFEILTLLNQAFLIWKKKPSVEGQMVGRLYHLASAVAVVVLLIYGLGHLGAVGAALAAFAGMLLGWSLQAPVSGFAAWVLISLKRPFRPGDRIQLPNLGMTGDVQEVGLMYTRLDQVGGSIGSEEAVGRHILVPNAMLFSQVVINYTVTQEAAFMLDELVIRITFDSDWAEAERILLNAAREETGDVVKATGVQPYIRSDMYDYGVYLRLRYQTRVKERVEISYRLQKKVFEAVLKTPKVDFAIPFVYSYRAVQDRRDDQAAHRAPQIPDEEALRIRQIEVARIRSDGFVPEAHDVDQIAHSIQAHGLLQPIVVAKDLSGDGFEVLAGHLRLAACRKLGWKTIPAVVREVK